MFGDLLEYDGRRTPVFLLNEVKSQVYSDMVVMINYIANASGLAPLVLKDEYEFGLLSTRSQLGYVERYTEAANFIRDYHGLFMKKFDELEALTTQWSSGIFTRGYKGEHFKIDPQARASEAFAKAMLSNDPYNALTLAIELVDSKILNFKAKAELWKLTGDTPAGFIGAGVQKLKSRFVIDDRQNAREIDLETAQTQRRVNAFLHYFQTEGIVDMDSFSRIRAASSINRLPTEDIEKLAGIRNKFTGKYRGRPDFMAFEISSEQVQKAK